MLKNSDLFPILAVFSAYIAIIYFIGYRATLKTKTLSDYVLGGRTLSGPVAALAAGASDMSSWLLLALPGLIYTEGLKGIWLPMGLVLGALLNWVVVAKPLRIQSAQLNDALTVPAYLSARFKDNSGILRISVSVVILIFFTAYVSAGFISGARLTESMLALSYHEALWISALLIVLYTCVGGFLAISWIDFFQGTLMLLALIIVPYVVRFPLGGIESSIQILNQIRPDFINPLQNISLPERITYLAWGLGYFGQLHILVRFMAVRSPNQIPMARNICLIWMILALLGAVATGFLGRAYFQETVILDPEKVFLELSQALFTPWVVGFLFAAVLSAIMSTISAQLIACSSVLAEDFYRTYCRKHASARESLWVARLSVLVVALGAFMMALNPENTIMNVVEYAWSGMGAAFGPLIVWSLYWRSMTRNGAIAGILVGAMTVVIWEPLKGMNGIFELGSLLPAFLLSSLAIYFTSRIENKDTVRNFFLQKYQEK